MTNGSLERALAIVAAADGPALDAAVDDLMEYLAAAPRAVPKSAARPLIHALRGSVSPVARRDVAHLLAMVVAKDSAMIPEAVEALVAQYGVARSDAFLGPELLHAIAKLAAHSAFARAALQTAVLRLTDQDTRFLLVRAAKIIGWFATNAVELGADGVLEQWTQSSDVAVQSEARMQRAIIALAKMLGVVDLAELEMRLREARRALLAAHASDEMRTDAARWLVLVELLQVYISMRHGGNADITRELASRAARLQHLVVDPSAGVWAGYAEGPEAIVEHRLFQTGLAFARLSKALEQAEEWTNLDAALVETAAALQLLVVRAEGDADGIGAAGVRIAAISGNVGGKPLGLFLSRAIGRVRVARIVADYESRSRTADDELVAQLRSLYDTVACAERTGTEPPLPTEVDVSRILQLTADQPGAVAAMCQAMPGLLPRLREAGVELARDGTGLSAFLLPADSPDLYGGDPAVDETVRPLLVDLWSRVGPRFPAERWMLLKAVVVFLVQIARDLRSDLPDFMLAEEDGGLGQQANEGDLQRYVFERLRREYGRPAVYEVQAISGGRADSGLQFETFAVAIEVKAEHSNISREHIRQAYLGQPNRYATDRDGIAVQLVLDVRSANAAGHRRAVSRGQPIHALYGLRDSFWVDALPSDPQVAVAHGSAVIVGLLPGNQPKPSSLTRYSSRPRRRVRK